MNVPVTALLILDGKGCEGKKNISIFFLSKDIK